jgi:hypothetical protein
MSGAGGFLVDVIEDGRPGFFIRSRRLTRHDAENYGCRGLTETTMKRTLLFLPLIDLARYEKERQIERDADALTALQSAAA